ncbi:MAG: hypothetical protein RIB60_03300 [Phycisphaerales bacterium]
MQRDGDGERPKHNTTDPTEYDANETHENKGPRSDRNTPRPNRHAHFDALLCPTFWA